MLAGPMTVRRCRDGAGALLLVALATSAGAAPGGAETPAATPPLPIALVVNTDDPSSVRIAERYREARCIPDERVVSVAFDPTQPIMDPREFRRIKSAVDEALDGEVQFLALAWARPNRVACMSMAMAFADDYDLGYCAKGCRRTRPSPYFDSDSLVPYTDFGLRPTFHVGAASEKEALALIERGRRSDGSRPRGTAYLVITPDKHRNVRAAGFEAALGRIEDTVAGSIVRSRGIVDRRDVLFYFTGASRVHKLATNRFVAGAVGDSLTSAGGNLMQDKQTTVLDWLSAGVTGTYGTVVEPCNFREKFPAPEIFAHRYVNGETLIESYWKSVRAPGQGTFIGEPLARPWGAPAACDARSARVTDTG